MKNILQRLFFVAGYLILIASQTNAMEQKDFNEQNDTKSYKFRIGYFCNKCLLPPKCISMWHNIGYVQMRVSSSNPNFRERTFQTLEWKEEERLSFYDSLSNNIIDLEVCKKDFPLTIKAQLMTNYVSLQEDNDTDSGEPWSTEKVFCIELEALFSTDKQEQKVFGIRLSNQKIIRITEYPCLDENGENTGKTETISEEAFVPDSFCLQYSSK